MGISGLLPLLKSIHKSTHIKAFAGQVVAIDAYGWLHRGTIACAVDLALDKPTRKYIDFTLDRVRMLRHYGVIPFMVFDGDYLPSKVGTEVEREKRRAAARENGLQLLNAGRTSQAQLELQKAIDVTPRMACLLIEELKVMGIKYVVAPYEADAQMAFLERKGLVSAIISEDSDLLVFGAKCLITKLDQYGECIEINRSDFSAVKEISLAGWSDEEFRRMAVLSGCDYLTNIPKMGLKTAYRIVRRHKTIDRILKALQVNGSYTIPIGYSQAFRKAELTFQYQRVFCPTTKSLVFCQESDGMPNLESEEMTMIGKSIADEIALGVAEGRLDPMTKMPINLKVTKSVSYKNLGRNQSLTNFFKLKSDTSSPSISPLIHQFNKTPLQERSANIQSSVQAVLGTVTPNMLKRTSSMPNLLNTSTSKSKGEHETTSKTIIHPKRRLREQEQDDFESIEESPFFRSLKKSKSSQSSNSIQIALDITPSQSLLSDFLEEPGSSLQKDETSITGSVSLVDCESGSKVTDKSSYEKLTNRIVHNENSKEDFRNMTLIQSSEQFSLSTNLSPLGGKRVRRAASPAYFMAQAIQPSKSRTISKQTSLDFSKYKFKSKYIEQENTIAPYAVDRSDIMPAP